MESRTSQRIEDGGTFIRAAVTALCGVILYLRTPDAFQHPQVWAEDGPVLFAGNLLHPWRSLVESYAGYFITVPRLTALIIGFLPFKLIPAGYFAVSVLLILLTCWMTLSPRLELPYKPLLAIAIVAAS